MDLGLKKTNLLMTTESCCAQSLGAVKDGQLTLVGHCAHTTNGKTTSPMFTANTMTLVKSMQAIQKDGQSVLLPSMRWAYPLQELPWNLLERH